MNDKIVLPTDEIRELKEFDNPEQFTTESDGIKYIGFSYSASKAYDLLNPILIIRPTNPLLRTEAERKIELDENNRIFESWLTTCHFDNLTIDELDEIKDHVFAAISFFKTPGSVRTELFRQFRLSTIRKINRRIKEHRNILDESHTLPLVTRIKLAEFIDRINALEKVKTNLQKTRSGELKALSSVLTPLHKVLRDQRRAQPVESIIQLINYLPDTGGFKATKHNIYDYLK